ncbi:hypothetical protein E3T24_11675 [Cryobacterium sp. TmT2-59]|uniref:hypothetical protein n=1 Tax=unclassified Cryobacterium TaxID=2649013 RepID=UPI00106A3192|nr:MULTISPECIES: hypothetical protein [unclassified Cryobacterium]TFC83651.1 hypothetical protein E3T24_11675 [Cryobacterium sp. TmT2-59]TFD27103.1 hypothetical protein E3T32_02285 [Cryobacterium sp. TMT2-23]
MRSLRLISLPLIVLGSALVLVTGCTAQSSAPSTTGSGSAPTDQVVVRPVSQAGLPAAGFTVTDDSAVTVDCGTTPTNARPSLVAVDDNILSCSPSSVYAVACWKDASPGSVLCFRDPWKVDLARMTSKGDLPTVPAPPAAQPLGLLLADGERCLMRSGGVWNNLAQYPGWYGTYSCTGGDAVWAGSADGIDRSSPRWSVQVAPLSGTGPLHTRDVVKAYVVGTAPSN